MSAVSSLTPLKFNPQFWVDLEVTGELINNQWTDDEKRGDARIRASGPSVSKDALKIVWEQVKGDSDRDNVKRSKEDTFNLLDDIDSEGLKCLFAAYEFTRGKKEKYISYYYKQIKSQVDTVYQDLYERIDIKNRRVGKTLFLYLYNQDALKSIFTLSHIDRPKPSAIGKASSSIPNPCTNIDQAELEEIARSSKRDAFMWHNFEYKKDNYITIKRHYRDAVDPQTRTNEEVEQAEYVVMRFYNRKVDIYTEKKPTASSMQNQLGNAFQSQTLNFESAEERKPNDHFRNKSPIYLVQEIDSLSNHTVIGIVTKRSGFTNNPSVKIRTDGERILPAIRDLRQANSSFFNDMRDINQIVINKNNTIYTLHPRQSEDYEWYVRYQAISLTDDERVEFEDEMENILEIEPFYVSSN